jgi:hypothetical protein
MLAVQLASSSSTLPIAAISVPSSGLDPVPSEPGAPVYVPPEWSPGFLRQGSEAATVDLLLSGMVGAGHSVASLSFYLGLDESEVRERVSALRLPRPSERPLGRQTSANPWSCWEVRLLIALWLDKVSAASIAAALGRPPSSVHGKRCSLGLGVRDPEQLVERSVADCRSTPLPWTPAFDMSAVVAAVVDPSPALGAPAEVRDGVKWALGRDAVKDKRFSILAFAGLRAPAIAMRMLVEFGVVLTISAVHNRISRLQIVRDRRDMISEYDEEAVERRAAAAMKRLGATLRQCTELNRSFWYCRTLGGSMCTCREFHTKKFQARRAARSWADVVA